MSFGQDMLVDTSIRSGRWARELAVVAQNAVHRLTTPRGALRGGEDEQSFGMDLPGRIGSLTGAREAAALPGQIRNELTKDRRIDRVDAIVTESTDGVGVSWTVEITCYTAEGSFTLAASAVTVEFVGLGGTS